MTSSGYNTPGDNSLVNQVRALSERVTRLERAPRAVATSVDSGALIVSDEGGLWVYDADRGHTVLFAGSVTNAIVGNQQVVNLFRDDGSVALSLSDNGVIPGHTHQQAMQWYDRGQAPDRINDGNVVVADDTNGGWGLARPHLADSGFAPVDPALFGGTTSASFTDIILGWREVQNPKVSWGFWIYTDGGVSAEFRIMMNSVQIGTTQSITNAWGLYQAYRVDVPPGARNFGGLYVVSVQARVLSGSGKARAACLMFTGDQS
jgi:hypothetical protein